MFWQWKFEEGHVQLLCEQVRCQHLEAENGTLNLEG